MKKKLTFLFLFMMAVFFIPSLSVSASEITDTGGGDATAITTEPTTQVSANEAQMDDIMNQDFVPKVKAEDFFAKLTSKLSETMTFGQKAAAFILAIMFLIALITLATSALGSRKDRILPSCLALLVIAIAFVCDIYVMDILGAFSNWMAN